MYYTLLRLWKQGRLSEDMLNQAVAYGWITQEQADFIKAQPKG